MYPNRYICTVLEEMRTCAKTMNFSYLPGLIEEAQTLANRMESKLEDVSDHKSLLDERDALHKEVQVLRDEKRKLQPE